MPKETKEKEKSVFDQFTGKYALSKTLRFELIPIGKTRENMDKHLRYDKKLQTFFADQEVEDAYQILKPTLDFIHEQFIAESLESETARNISFSEYLEIYKKRKDLRDKDFEAVEKPLRAIFSKAFEEAAINFKHKAGKNSKGKDILSENGYNILTEKGILEYIEKNIREFSEIKSKEEIQGALKVFQGFFTYFGGFNQNRENYYETGKEAATAVASRIVHENLPKFCDNVLFFEDCTEEYKNIYDVLNNLGKSLFNKEEKALYPIEESLFKITHFNKCLSQTGIEKYNDQIGNANFLINLYNQTKKDERGFNKLSFFKTLYKQIGCGKRDSFFLTIKYDKKIQVKENINKETSLEDVLERAVKAGKKYFKGRNNDGAVNTVPEFLEYIIKHPDYYGIYWSKQAINTISNKYFANWHELKDKLKDAKVFKKADKASGEDVATPPVVELGELFRVLDSIPDWRESIFKASILENESKNVIVVNSNKSSQALLNLIFFDIKEHMKAFLEESGKILEIEDYKKDSIAIKSWLDHALSISQILKYFQVGENKVKGKTLDSTVSQALVALLRPEDAEWFKWYDGIRNYLTKKPQDDLKQNKLKLNFQNSTLAAGWDVNKEPDNFTIILQNSEGQKLLAIIAKRSNQKGFNKIFEKSENNQLYKIDSNSEILEKMEYKLLPGPNKMLPKCLLPGLFQLKSIYRISTFVDKSFIVSLSNSNPRLAYLEDKTIMDLSDYAKKFKLSHANLINKAKRQTIEAFMERGVWKIGVSK